MNFNVVLEWQTKVGKFNIGLWYKPILISVTTAMKKIGAYCVSTFYSWISYVRTDSEFWKFGGHWSVPTSGGCQLFFSGGASSAGGQSSSTTSIELSESTNACLHLAFFRNICRWERGGRSLRSKLRYNLNPFCRISPGIFNLNFHCQLLQY